MRIEDIKPTTKIIGQGVYDTGYKYPSATGETYNEWTDPANAYSSDNTYASASSNSKSQDYYNFSLNVPTGAVISKISVLIEAYQPYSDYNGDGATNVIDRLLMQSQTAFKIAVSGDAGASYSSEENISGINDTDTVRYVGTGLWGKNWSSSELSDSNFRVRIKTNKIHANDTFIKYLDYIKASVEYSLADDLPKITKATIRDMEASATQTIAKSVKPTAVTNEVSPIVK